MVRGSGIDRCKRRPFGAAGLAQRAPRLEATAGGHLRQRRHLARNGHNLIVGAIGAVVLYLVFAAGLLKGDLFPEFSCLNAAASCGAFHDFVSSWAPANATANAKAIVWGFVAGFSERFVPDVLNRLGSRESKAPP